MAYTTIDDPTIYFNTKLYAGNNSTQSITGVGFQPDWVWLKSRSDAGEHTLYDSVRGATKRLDSADNGGEDTVTNGLTSFDSNGFSLGAGGNENSASSLVSWNWLAGGSASSNSNGSITSSVSASTTAGFSIVSYTGNGSSSATVGHGLNAVPKVVICKKRSGSGAFNWHMRHEDLTSNHNLWIDATDAEYDMTNEVNNGGLANLSSSSTFGFLSGVQNADAVNESSGTFIAYCFAEKKGYSKFGSYTGNGNADGVFVYTGFKPAFVFVKKTSGGQARNWCILDNKREGFNPENDQLHSNTTGAESMGSGSTGDLLSNGFKFRATDDDKNGSYPYIYMAFAESPFVTSTGIPTTAR